MATKTAKKSAAKKSTAKKTATKAATKKATPAKAAKKSSPSKAATEEKARRVPIREQIADDVIRLNAEGMSNKDIAAELGVQPVYVSHVLQANEPKITARNDADLGKKIAVARDEERLGWKRIAFRTDRTVAQVRDLYTQTTGRDWAESDIGKGGRDFGGGARAKAADSTPAPAKKATTKKATKAAAKSAPAKKATSKKASAKSKSRYTADQVDAMPAAELKTVVKELGVTVPKGSKVSEVRELVKAAL